MNYEFIKKTIHSSSFIVYIFLCISLFILSACVSQADLNSVKLSFFKSSSGKKTFSFVVGEDLIKRHYNSKPSNVYPKMTEVELKLLKKVLQDNKYCINKNGELSFKITSKQEKIYDVTFPNLIERNYRAKSITPTTYFGECI